MINEPSLEILKVKDLEVDQYAQRTYKDAHAQHLADSWDPEQVGIFKVSRRAKGQLMVLDGQHRRSAMLKLDKDAEEIFALVYEGLTLSEEAKIFLRDNVKNRKPTTVDIFRISVVAEDPVAVEIDKVLRDRGLHVALDAGNNSVPAVGALNWLYERGGAVLLGRTLDLVDRAWGAEARGGRDGNMLKGLGYVLSKATGATLDVESLAFKLGAEAKPSQLLGRARTHKHATGAALWREMANVAVAIYNKQRTTRRISL